MIERDGYKIVTHYECPPIPIRSMDWSACEHDNDDADWDGERWVIDRPVGYGATEEEAIEDLLRQLKEIDVECGYTLKEGETDRKPHPSVRLWDYLKRYLR